jgi:hypothetical protein
LLDEEGFFRGNLAMKDEPEPPDFGPILDEPALAEPSATAEGEPQPETPTAGSETV